MKNPRFIPLTYSLIFKDEEYQIEVWGIIEGKIVAQLFQGKKSKPDWHYRFDSIERLNARIADSKSGYASWADSKAKRKAEREAPHDVKVGDVFRCSWGYDQTNIDYYQCTAIVGERMIEIRQIGQETEETGFMQGECVPSMNHFIGEPMRKKVKMYSGEASVSIYSFANAYRMKPVAKIGNSPVYQSSHWTAYA